MKEYRDFNQYKIVIKKKVYEHLEKEQKEILKPLKIALSKEIFKNIDENRHFRNGKIFLDMQLFVELHSKEIFKKNALTVHNLIKELKAKSFISKLSQSYPKNQVLFSANPLNSSYLNNDLSKYDTIINLRDSFVNTLKNCKFSNDRDKNLNYETNLFIYFKLFLIQKIPNTYFKYFIRSNILYIKDMVILIIQEEAENGFIPLYTIIFDEFSSSILKEIFPKNISSIFENNEYIFTEEYDFYNNKLSKFCKENNLLIKDIKNAIKFEYQLYSTPLALTLKSYLNYPRISLLELEKLYPKSIKQELLKIERNNLKIYRNINKEYEIIEDNDEELQLEKVLNTNSEIYDKLKEIIKVPKNKHSFQKYLEKWYLFIKNNKNRVKEFEPIFTHIEQLLKKSDMNFNKSIEPLTLQNYLQVIFHYCFDVMVKSVNNDDALKNIDYKLKNSELNPKVQIKYQNRILLFLKEELGLEFDRIKSITNYNRSIIFEDELDKIIQKLQYRDKKKYKCEILVNRRAVFIILAYYTGLRKSELVSRTLRDFYHSEDNNSKDKFFINVNRIGINKINKKNKNKIVSLKNRNAKRAFEFEIKNSRHLKIVKTYYDNLTRNKVVFLFPNTNLNKTVSKKNSIDISSINEINSILQDTTKRYTVLHSFRHTYVTNEIKKLLSKKEKRIEDIFDLISKIGHDEFETTLKNYAHLDLLTFL